MNEIALYQSKALWMVSVIAHRVKIWNQGFAGWKARKQAPLKLQVWFYVDADIFRDRIDVNLLARERKQLCWTPEFETLLINKASDHVFVSIQKPQFKVLHKNDLKSCIIDERIARERLEIRTELTFLHLIEKFLFFPNKSWTTVRECAKESRTKQ